MSFKLLGGIALSSLVVLTHAHVAAFHNGMYCINGSTPGVDNQNNADPVSPLFNLKKSEYWFHAVNGCDKKTPAEGDFLELPAGSTFTVELSGNQAFTHLSYGGRYFTDWGNGGNYPDDLTEEPWVSSPNLHAQNHSMAAGTAFAISYKSNISEVTIDNLVVFTVRYQTPWKVITTYDVPQDMPPCPEDGCTCAFLWIPNGCGQPNIYMHGSRCKVTNSTSTVPIATPKPPVWCEDDPTQCTQGAKQVLIWNQAEDNNIEVQGYDLSGSPKSPAYNSKCGFQDGAQNDIFDTPNTSSSSNPTKRLASKRKLRRSH